MGWRAVAALVLVAELSGGCARPVRRYRCVPAQGVAAVDPAELWSCNRDVMKRAAKGRKFSIKEFEEASRFFEELTSIPADSLETPLGPLPGPQLEDSIRRWDAWCLKNCDRLQK